MRKLAGVFVFVASACAVSALRSAAAAGGSFESLLGVTVPEIRKSVAAPPDSPGRPVRTDWDRRHRRDHRRDRDWGRDRGRGRWEPETCIARDTGHEEHWGGHGGRRWRPWEACRACKQPSGPHGNCYYQCSRDGRRTDWGSC